MAVLKNDVVFKRLDEIELSLCLYLNRLSRRQATETFFTVVSRMGDGIFWYCLILIIVLLDYPAGIGAGLHMGAGGLIALFIYKQIKTRMARQRPSITWEQIRRGTAPLDLYSFPSGHTLHAVCFSMIAVYYYPWLGSSLFTFTLLIALSRVILGLHYPTDVAVGAIIGGVVAVSTINFIA